MWLRVVVLPDDEVCRWLSLAVGAVGVQVLAGADFVRVGFRL